MNPDETPNTDRESYEKRIHELEKELERYKAYFEIASTQGHGLRVPLSSVIGFSSVLLELTSLTEEQADDVKLILQNGYFLLETINHFINLAKLISSRMELQPRPDNIREFADGIIQNLSKKAVEKKITLSLFVEQEIAELVQYDHRCLQIVLYDLVTDSIKFSQAGKVEVFLKLMQVETADFLHFEVFSPQMEIPVAAIGRLQKFFDGTGNHTELISHISLNLINAKLLCDLMQGKIWVESQEQGVAFHFTIPYVPSVADGH